VCQAVVGFSFQGLVLLFELREVRLHRHAECLLNPWISRTKTSLAQKHPRIERERVNATKALWNRTRWRGIVFASLAGGCGKRDTEVPSAGPIPAPAGRTAVPMTDEDERALREQLARLQQEHRDLDAAIAALIASPGVDLIQVQRLKKRKLVLRDKIRAIEDQLTPDIIA
jgi:hypothetical protein